MYETDVVIIGGSVAGLQAALTLGRARRRVVVIDDGRPRNRPASHVHNFLTQTGPTPGDLLASARSMLEPYDVQLLQGRVTNVEAVGDESPRFEVFTDDGQWATRSIVLATGLDDELPDAPGVAKLWGERVVACPHCHGWEVRDQPLAQLGLRGLPKHAVSRALLLSRWSSNVLLFTDGDPLTEEELTRLSTAGVRVRTERVQQVEPNGDGLDVVLANHERVHHRALFVATRQHQQTDLAARLGCRLVAEGREAGAVSTDQTGHTSISGVWAAGTTAVPSLLAIGAAGHASAVATSLHSALLEQEIVAPR